MTSGGPVAPTKCTFCDNDGKHESRLIAGERYCCECAGCNCGPLPTTEAAEPSTNQRSLAELQRAYLEARRLTLPIVTGREQCQYILGEAAELAVAGKYLDVHTDDWGGVPSYVRCEIADVVLAVVTLANQLGVTVEDCIAEKTEEDRDRG